MRVHYSSQGVNAYSALQPFTVPNRLHEVSRRFNESFRLFSAVSEAQKRSGTLDVQDRSEIFILYMINGPKRTQNQVHGTFTFTLQKRKNLCNPSPSVPEIKTLFLMQFTYIFERTFIKVKKSAFILLKAD